MSADFKEQLAAALTGNDSAAASSPQDSSTFTTVAHIIAATAHLDEEKLTQESRLEADLNIDSLTLLEISIRLEDRFGMELEAHDITEAGTIGAVAGLVETANATKADTNG